MIPPASVTTRFASSSATGRAGSGSAPTAVGSIGSTARPVSFIHYRHDPDDPTSIEPRRTPIDIPGPAQARSGSAHSAEGSIGSIPRPGSSPISGTTPTTRRASATTSSDSPSRTARGHSGLGPRAAGSTDSTRADPSSSTIATIPTTPPASAPTMSSPFTRTKAARCGSGPSAGDSTDSIERPGRFKQLPRSRRLGRRFRLRDARGPHGDTVDQHHEGAVSIRSRSPSCSATSMSATVSRATSSTVDPPTRARAARCSSVASTDSTPSIPTRSASTPVVPNVVITDIQLFNQSIGVGEEVNGRILLESFHHIHPTHRTVLPRQRHHPRVRRASLQLARRETATNTACGDSVMSGSRSRPIGDMRPSPVSAPGRYLFSVRGANSDGFWNDKGASLAITVKPPFWATWWFRLVALASLAGIAMAVAQSRLRGVRMKTQLAAAHDAQMAIMPQAAPEVPGVEIAGAWIPAYGVGGDFYDYFWLDDEPQRLCIVVGRCGGQGNGRRHERGHVRRHGLLPRTPDGLGGRDHGQSQPITLPQGRASDVHRAVSGGSRTRDSRN